MPDIITPKPATKPRPKSVSFKVPPELHAELESLKRRVQQHRHEIDFHLDLVMADALKKSIRLANQHLDQLERSSD